jgi:CRISPR/Cas system-associated exonuclease Cas4 (RecB family)
MARTLDGAIRFRKAAVTDGFSTAKVIEALEAGYLTKKREDKWTQKTSFAPSSLAYGKGFCPRYWYLAFEGNDFVETNDAKSVPVMENGTVAGKRIADAFRDAGVLVGDEVEVRLTDPPVRGFIDVIVRIGTDVVVGEIKTTSQEIFNLKQVSMKPTPAHLLQILIYLKATGKKKGFLMYECRNDLSVLIMEVDFDEKNEALLEQALEWMRLVYKSFEDKELPKRPFRSQSGKVCMECPVNKVCWEERPEGTVKIPKMEVPTV